MVFAPEELLHNLERDRKFIETIVIPKLVKNKRIKIENIENYDNNLTKIKSVRISMLGVDGTFSISGGYQLKVILLNGDVEQLFELMIKITPDVQEAHYVASQFNASYRNEAIAYTDLIPIFADCKKYPKMYDYGIDELHAFMVFDDFKLNGYRMCEMMANLSLDHILLAVIELGKFHGKLFLEKAKYLPKFLKIVQKYEECRYTRRVVQTFQRLFNQKGPLRTIKSFRYSEIKHEIPESFLAKLEKLFEDPFHLCKSLVQPIEPLAIICHGDYLRNNIAFQYKKDEMGNEVPTDAMMFDFQTVRYASPMVDLTLFLCMSSGIDVRQPNFDKIFDTYFNELMRNLKAELSESEIPSYFNREIFLKEYARLLPYGIAVSSSFLPYLHCPDEIVVNKSLDEFYTEEEIMHLVFTTGGEQIDRELRGMVQELYRLQNEYNVDVLDVKFVDN